MPKPKTKKPKVELGSNRQALAKDMDEARKELEAIPSDHEWEMSERDDMESLRRSALDLAYAVEAIFEEIHGYNGLA